MMTRGEFWAAVADRLETAVLPDGSWNAPPPQCEARWECPEHGVEACDEPATERVTIVCTADGCGNAAEMLLLCSGCAEQTATRYHATRRPL
jgi:hypothetical protein